MKPLRQKSVTDFPQKAANECRTYAQIMGGLMMICIIIGIILIIMGISNSYGDFSMIAMGVSAIVSSLFIGGFGAILYGIAALIEK